MNPSDMTTIGLSPATNDQQSPIPSHPSSALLSSPSMATKSIFKQNAPCAGCKFLRRKCNPDCIFKPYFLPEQQQMFALVHSIFGASNVARILTDLHPRDRRDAVVSLVYESKMHFIDPIYGCVRTISALQQELKQIQFELVCALAELSRWEAAMASLEERKLTMEEQKVMTMSTNECAGPALDKEISKEMGVCERQFDFAEDDELRSLLQW